MCNASGHSRYCNCGFGGDTGGGGTPLREAITKIRGSGWSISTLRSRLTHPTRCWWCEKHPVYFHRDENGGCALFDALGWPWQVHDCWRKHREEQRARAISNYERELRLFGYNGITYPSRATPVLAPFSASEQPVIQGFIVRIVATDPLPAGRAKSAAEVHWVEVQAGDALYRVVFPARVAALLRPHQIVAVDGWWLRRERKWHLLARSVSMQSAALGKERRVSGWMWSDAPTCTWCQRAIVPETAWGIHPENGFECPACGTQRGSLTPADFRERMKIQKLLDESAGHPVPPELVGSYSLDCKGGMGGPLKFTLSNDRRWRTEYGQAGGRSCITADVVRLYDDVRLLYTFRIIRSAGHDGVRLQEMEKDRSPFRKGRMGSYEGVRFHPRQKKIERPAPVPSTGNAPRPKSPKKGIPVRVAKPEGTVRGWLDTVERTVVQIQRLEGELDGLYPRLERERDPVRRDGLSAVVREKSARVQALVTEARGIVKRLREVHNKTAKLLLLHGGPALRQRLYSLEKRVPASARQRPSIPSPPSKPAHSDIRPRRKGRRAESGFGALLKQAIETPGQAIRHGQETGSAGRRDDPRTGSNA